MKSTKALLVCLLLAGLLATFNCQVPPAANDTATASPVVSLTTAGTAAVENVKPEITNLPTTADEQTTVSPITDSNNGTLTVAPPPLQPETTPLANDTTTEPPTTTTTITTPAPTTTTTPANTTSTVPPTTSTTSTTTTPTTSTTTTTTTTTPAPSPQPVPPCRRFNGPSFIGGIVLTLGLLAIGLVAYKFYKARNDRNYHTL